LLFSFLQKKIDDVTCGTHKSLNYAAIRLDWAIKVHLLEDVYRQTNLDCKAISGALLSRLLSGQASAPGF
jgi:hypothetical protein